jgi:starvation-inducible DNA-binding protein
VLHPTRIDLSAEKRTLLVSLLNEQLVDLIDLSLQFKHAHWNVRGPHFLPLHELFDKLHGELAGPIDEIAERLGALGGVALGTVQMVSERTHLPAYNVHLVQGRDHLDALATVVSKVGKSVREKIDQTAELGDADTADLLTGISRLLDQQLWFLESHLQG